MYSFQQYCKERNIKNKLSKHDFSGVCSVHDDYYYLCEVCNEDYLKEFAKRHPKEYNQAIKRAKILHPKRNREMSDKCFKCSHIMDEEVDYIWCWGCSEYICEKCYAVVAELCNDCWREEEDEYCVQKWAEEESCSKQPYDDYDG